MSQHPRGQDTEVFAADIHSAIGAYVLNALEADERAAFERHLARCASCRDDVAEMTAAATHLAVLTVTAPPAELRDRTLAQIRQTRQAASVIPAQPDSISGDPEPPTAPAPTPAGDGAVAGAIDELALARARKSARVARWVGAAAIIIALVAGGGYVHSHHRLDQANQQIQASTTLLDAPDLRTARAPVAGGGSALVLASASEGKMLLTASGLKVLDPAHTYQVWVMQPSGTATSLGTFDTSTGSVRAAMAGELTGPVTLGISIEPAGGSPQPTTKPVFAQKLTS